MCPLGHHHQLESGKKGIATGAAADQNGQIWEQPDNIQTNSGKPAGIDQKTTDGAGLRQTNRGTKAGWPPYGSG